MNRITIITAALLAATITPALSRSLQDDPPDQRLIMAYMAYAHVAWCHEARAGYAYQAISPVELDRAKAVVKAVAAQSTKADPSIDTNRAWELSVEAASKNMEPRKVDKPGFREVCQDVLRQLYELSPTPVYRVEKP